MNAELTPRQRSVLEFIIAFEREHRMAPTVREIGRHLGLSSPSGIHRILTLLKEKGFLLTEPGKNRSWRFSKEIPGRGIPLIGAIAGGRPIEALEDGTEELPISPAIFGRGSYFALRVQGESMTGAHILDGDVAIIRPQPRVENGEIAAVLIQELLPEATLKIVRYTRQAIRLEPANPAYEVLEFKGRRRKIVSILGRCVGIIRRR
jgi:repressor LexA